MRARSPCARSTHARALTRNAPSARQDVHRCPASDASDSYLYLASPFEHEATLDFAPSESFYGDLEQQDRSGAARAKLLERFAGHYQRWLARVGPPIY